MRQIAQQLSKQQNSPNPDVPGQTQVLLKGCSGLLHAQSRTDGALLLALHDSPPSERLLTVFVHTQQPPVDAQVSKLEALGIAVGERPRKIFTATLSPYQVSGLSHRDWIKSSKLSQKLQKRPGQESSSESV